MPRSSLDSHCHPLRSHLRRGPSLFFALFAVVALVAGSTARAQSTFSVTGGGFVNDSNGISGYDVVSVSGTALNGDRSTLDTPWISTFDLTIFSSGLVQTGSAQVSTLTVNDGGSLTAAATLTVTDVAVNGPSSSVVSGSATVFNSLTISGGGSFSSAGGLGFGTSGASQITVSHGSTLTTGTLDSFQGQLAVLHGGSVVVGGNAQFDALTISSTTATPSVFTANAPVTIPGAGGSLQLGAGGVLDVYADVTATGYGHALAGAVNVHSGTLALPDTSTPATASFTAANPLGLHGGKFALAGQLAFSGSGSFVRTGGSLSAGALTVTNAAVTLAAGDVVGGTITASSLSGTNVVAVASGGVLTVQGSINASDAFSPGNVTVANGGRLILDGGSVYAANTSGLGGYGTLSVSGANGLTASNGGSYSVDFLALDGAVGVPVGDIRRGITLANGATLMSSGAFALDVNDLGSRRLLSVSSGSNAGIFAPSFSVGNGVDGTVSISGRSVSATPGGGGLDLSLNGSGTVTVVGSQTLGSLTIAGTATASSQALISGTSSIDILSLGSGGRLIVNAPVDAMGSSLSLASGGQLVLNANVDARDAFMSVASAVTINSGTLNVNPLGGVMAHPTLSFSTTNPLVLNGGRLSGGAISFSGSGALVRSGGVLDIGPLSVSNAAITLLAGDSAGAVDASGPSPQGSDVNVGSGGVLTVRGRITTSAYQSPGDITVSNGGRLILDGGTISARHFDSSGGYGTLTLSGSNAITVNSGRYDVDTLVLDNGASLSANAGSVAHAITLDNGATLVSSGPYLLDGVSITSSNGGGIDAPSFTVSGNVGGMLSVGGRTVNYTADAFSDLDLYVSGGTVSLSSGTLGMLIVDGTSSRLDINGPVTGSPMLSGSGGLIVVNATCDLAGASVGLWDGAMTINSGTFAFGTSGAGSGLSFTTSRPLTMTGGRLVAGGLSLSGSGSLVRTGGSLALAGLSVASGSFALAAGDVVSSGIAMAPGGSDVVTVGSGATLTVQGSINTTNSWFDGNVAVNGGGQLVLAGGAITAGDGSVTVASGGRLVLSSGTLTALNNDLTMGGANGTLSISGSSGFARTGGSYLVDALSIGGGASVTFAGGDLIRDTLTIGGGSLLTTQVALEILGQEPWSNQNTPGSLSIASGGELRLTAWTSEYVPSAGEGPGTTVLYGFKIFGNYATELAAMLADGRITGTNQTGTLGVYYADPVGGAFLGSTYLTTTAVPEPSSLVLAGLGIACGWRRLARRRAPRAGPATRPDAGR